MENKVDVLIVGGGIVGLTLAVALLKYTSLHIALLDEKKLDHPVNVNRVSAVNLASERILQKLDVWDVVKTKASVFREIAVWEMGQKEALTFHAANIHAPHLGYIIANDHMLFALLEKAKTFERFNFYPATPLSDNHVSAKLMVAADGTSSVLRKQAGISVDEYAYQQAAIVATIRTEKPHEKKARQVFLKTGPLAFLPLQDPHLTSIVWSLPIDMAKEMRVLADEAFLQQLFSAFDKLGQLTATTERLIFPLKKQQAKNYIADRTALIGDAAHTMHPLAGQGLNVGLLDAASLFDVIHTAHNNREDMGDDRVLRRYERWRRADNQLMLQGVHQVKHFFAQEKQGMSKIRQFGMKMMNQLPWLKNEWIKYAVGDKRIQLPTLAEK